MQQKLRLNIGTQTKTENSSLPEIISKTPRMILRNLQTTKLRSYDYINTDRDIKLDIISTHSRQNSIQRMNLSQCKQRITKLANDDNRVSLPNLKKWNKDKAKQMISEYMKINNKYQNKIVMKLPDYERTAPFISEQFQFIDKILPKNLKIKKQLGISEESIIRNNLLLEKILLEKLL